MLSEISQTQKDKYIKAKSKMIATRNCRKEEMRMYQSNGIQFQLHRINK